MPPNSNNKEAISSTSQYAAIKASLLSIYPFNEEQVQLFYNRLQFRKTSKKEFLVKPATISNSLHFIFSGSVRFYSRSTENEITINFFTENQWCADMESLLLQQPSVNFLETTTSSEIATILLKDLHELMDVYPVFRMLNALLGRITIPATHLATLHTKSPDARYQELLANHPDWINRFPQLQIASYLGITPETLSRVRARLS